MKVNTNKAIEFLLARGNLPILFWLKKDILEVPVDRESKNLEKYAARIRILEKQKPNGGWCSRKYDGHSPLEKTQYIVDTLKNTQRLFNFGCSLEEPALQKAVKFLYSTQTKDGDFRGAYLNEYAPTYHALTLEVLCQFGLGKDKRTLKGFQWLTKNVQNDGGWVIPYRTVDKSQLKTKTILEERLKQDPVKPDKTKPSSHLVTGMVLRAMAASPTYRKSKEAKRAGDFLMKRFFKPDVYEDRRLASYWEEITFPFWATDILSSLDALASIGFTPEHKEIRQALNWLLKRQSPQGYWRSGLKKTPPEEHLWVTLVVLRVFKKFGLVEI